MYTVLAKDLSLLPSTHVCRFTATSNSNFKESLIGPPLTPALT